MKKFLVSLTALFFLFTAGVAFATPFYATQKSQSPNVSVYMPGFGNITVHSDYWLETTEFGRLDAFCVQSANAGSGTFNMLPVPDDYNMQRAAWYAEQYWTHNADNLTKADFQVAIWDTVIDGFKWKSGAGGNYMSVYNWASSLQATTVSYAQIDGKQDFLVNHAQPVPEPATMLLLGFGLMGMTVVGRRKFLK